MWAMDEGEDVDLAVHLDAARGGVLDGDDAAREEHDLCRQQTASLDALATGN